MFSGRSAVLLTVLTDLQKAASRFYSHHACQINVAIVLGIAMWFVNRARLYAVDSLVLPIYRMRSPVETDAMEVAASLRFLPGAATTLAILAAGS